MGGRGGGGGLIEKFNSKIKKSYNFLKEKKRKYVITSLKNNIKNILWYFVQSCVNNHFY